MRHSRQNKNRIAGRTAFTLVEVLAAIIIVGLAIAALVAASGSFTQVNAAGFELSTAEFLIEQIKELTATLPVDDLYDFNGAVFSPPNFAAWSQRVTVQDVNRSDFNQTMPNHSSDFVRVTVRIFLNSREISSASWLRARY